MDFGNFSLLLGMAAVHLQRKMLAVVMLLFRPVLTSGVQPLICRCFAPRAQNRGSTEGSEVF